MSKEIAQTVGGKRIAWLIAIMAAFAVFATVGSQWQGAKANATAADIVVTGPFTTATGTTAVTTPTGLGTTVYYHVATVVTGLSAGYSNPVVVTFTFPTGITPVAGTVVSGPSPTFSSVSGQTITATYTSLNTASVFDLAFQGTTSSRAVVAAGTSASGAASCPADQACGSIDDASIQAAQNGANTATTLLTIQAAGLTVGKAHAPSSPANGGNVTYTITVGNPVTASVGATATTVVIADTLPASYVSVASVAGSAGVTCSPSTFPSTTLAYTCSLASLAEGATATVTITATLATIPQAAAGQPATCSTVTNTATASASNAPTASGSDTFTYCGDAGAAIVNSTVPALVHINPATGLPLVGRDTDNNVIGFLHAVCALNVTVDALWPTPLAGPGFNFKIDTISGAANITSPQISTGIDCDADGFADDSQIIWYSTQPGEQNIVVVNDAGSVVLDGNGVTVAGTLSGLTATNCDRQVTSGCSTGTTPIVKEWNTLAPTTITATTGTAAQAAGSAASGNLANLDGTQGTLAVTFNPATGAYQAAAGATVFENILATHTNAAGTQLYFAQGARVTFTATGTCGSFTLTGGFIQGAVGYLAQYNPSGGTANVTTSVSVTTTGAPIQVTLNTNNNCVLLGGASIGFTAQANYPARLGSNQPPAPALESYSVRLTAAIATKQVFLAWAGQRIILEHDWRIPAGDTNPISFTVGACTFPNTPVTYIKGSGPGNFVPGLGATLNGSDQATVQLYPPGSAPGQIGDAPIFPGDACISRVLYESEDPGEVDIEAFVPGPSNSSGFPIGFNSTKVAFVVYYMKLNTVAVSLVSSVSKPLHNATDSDYAPGNPWDASKDVTVVDWNVSKDLLVRGRVTGWFLNSNPSGRAADTSDPLNVLPANRWVMPNDWALLAGGPADNADNSPAIGTAENFRPEYDIMINPARGNRGLDTPEGTFLASAATLGADLAATGTTVTIKLPQTGTIVLGATIRIDNEDMTVLTAPVANALGTLATFTVNRGQNGTGPAAHTTGAIVLVYGAINTPFEGPFSLIDLPALGASAALSSLIPGAIRDTMWKDGDVDWWDAPMPPALVTVDIRGTGFIKQVLKQDVYYNGTANSTAGQTYPNPFYITNIPDSPYIPAVVAGGGFYWDSWGNDGELAASGQGVYRFWRPIPNLIQVAPGQNPVGTVDSTASSASSVKELNAIRAAYLDNTIGRTLVVYSDNHGEFMVTANGDFKTDLSACASSPLGGASSKHCKPGDKVGTGSIYATVDYPDFRGKHFPVKSNTATVTWLWGGYKDVTVEPGETDQFKYVVFHGLDRDGFCSAASFGAVSLHPVLSGAANDTFNGNPAETVDFLIDSGEGIIIGSSSSAAVNVTKQFATGATTFSTLVNDPAVTGIKEFPLSSLAAAGATDECQTWIRVSNSLLGILNVLVIAHDDTAEGDIGFDKIIDLTNTTSYTLNFRWSLVTWAGANDIAVADALKGTGTSGKNPGGNDISASVTAVYGWDQAAQQWLGYFPTGVNVPGANDLTTLKTGQAYWIAITGPGSVTWTVATNVN